MVCLFVGVSAWFLHSDDLFQPTEESTLESSSLKDLKKNLTSHQYKQTPQEPLASLAKTSEPKIASSNSDGQSKQSQLAIEREKLVLQKQKLENLRRQLVPLQQPAAVTRHRDYGDQVKVQLKQQLQDSVLALRATHQLELQITREAEDFLYEQSNQAQILRDQIEESLRLLQDQITTTLEQKAYWQSNNSYTPEKTAHLSELESRLQSQYDQLDFLRQRRQLIYWQVWARTRALQQDKQQSLSALAENQEELENEQLQINKMIADVEQQQLQQRNAVLSLNSQIAQAQRELDRLEEKNRSLETQSK